MPMLPFDRLQAATDALARVWKNRTCPVCSETTWVMSPNVFELREFHGGDLNLMNSQILPLLSLSCTTCGNTMLFNAIRLGAVSPTKGGLATPPSVSVRVGAAPDDKKDESK